MGDLRKRLLAILAADVAGYSRLMEVDDRATVSMLDAARSVFRHQIGAHGGRVVDMAGDSVLAVFDTATGAMSAALDVQRILAVPALADASRELQLQFRIGIHIGDVIEKVDGSVYGDGVNVAARLEALATPGAIAVSQAVHGIVAHLADAVFEDIGEQAVRNIAKPVRAFRARGRAVGEASSGNAAETIVRRERTLPGNLPEVASIMVAREGDLAALRELVRTSSIVTLVGAGGIGKTRLGLALGHAMGDEFDDGAWLVELASTADATLLLQTVAQALGIALTGRRPAQDEVIEALVDRAMLLVLDNCEHVVAAAGSFASALVGSGSRTRLLATSQEPLHVPGERVYRLETLPVPATPTLPAARAYGAIALFEHRVRALMPRFGLDESNITDAVRVCEALDGLPLAIEFAAARVPLLGVAGVREHLHERFRLLTRGSRDAERRHQTLLEALDWSHELLDADERAVFRRIGTFSGGFTLAAAQHVAADAELSPWAVLDHLGALVDKSLLVVDDVEPRRYRLLESARAYALERLAEGGDHDEARDRHASYFVAEAEAAEPRLTSADRLAWLKRLRAELGNFRGALSWLVRERKDARSALRLAGSLAWFAYFEGLFEEWKRWLDEALALPGAESCPRERAAALSGAARLAAYSGDAAKGESMAETSIRLWREVGDVRGLAYALFHKGIVRLVQSRPDAAQVALQEALTSFRALSDPWGIALGSSYLGSSYVLVPGSEDRARPLLLEGRAGFRALGDEWGASVSSHYLGSIALRTGDHETARDLTLEMLVNARSLGDRYRMSRNLHQLAEIDLAQGRTASAARQLHESLCISSQQGRIGDAVQQVRLLTAVAMRSGEDHTAARLVGFADRHAGAQRTMPADDPDVYAKRVADIRERLGASEFEVASVSGSALSLQQVIALATTLVPPAESGAAPRLGT